MILYMDEYAIYLRKSRADAQAEMLGEGETLARHKKILIDLAAKLNIHVAKIYQEIVSGETIEARDEIQQLIKDCYAGMYKGIIVVEVTRLSRGNQGDAQIIMDCLKYGNNGQGILVVTPTKIYDVLHNPDDEEYMEFELFMSRREYKMIRKRMERGKFQSVVEGNYMGSARPYGYDILKTKSGRTLIPNQDEAQIVKNIFNWAAYEHLTAWQICKRLDTLGVPTYTGKPEWALSTVKTILLNPIYIGKVRWNYRKEIKNLVDGKLVTSRPRHRNDPCLLYDGKHEAIIDDITFHKVASRVRSDKTKGGLKLRNPLASILICAKCKKAMAYQPYDYRPSTNPRFMHAPSTICKIKSVAEKDVMNALVYALNLYIDDFKMVIDDRPSVDENNVLNQIEILRKELSRQERKLPKLFDAWEDGLIDNNEFIKRKGLNQERIESIKKQLAHLQETIPTKSEYEEKIMSLSDALQYLSDPSLDADIKNNYLKSIIGTIEYSRKNDREFILDISLKE